MRKLLYYFQPSVWLLLILCVAIILAVIFNGCALSLKAPTPQMLIQDATYIASYTIGRENPTLAKEFIKYTQVDREDILTLYPSWQNYLSYRLEDPIHRRLVGTMLGLVDIDLQLKVPTEQEKIIRELFREFISGLKAGIDATK